MGREGALGKTSVTFVNDMIARAVLGSFAEALKVGPGADRLHEADPLDLVGHIQHFQATEYGSHDGDLNNDNGQYCTAIVASITNAADKPHKTRAE